MMIGQFISLEQDTEEMCINNSHHLLRCREDSKSLAGRKHQ